tara:strand:- start:330 stop:629 length:300 start_codon:yes stop_codon:yes gene_type:complete
MARKFLGLPARGIERGPRRIELQCIRFAPASPRAPRVAVQSLRDWKWVRAKVSISAQNDTSRFESAEGRGSEAAALGRKPCRYATRPFAFRRAAGAAVF